MLELDAEIRSLLNKSLIRLLLRSVGSSMIYPSNIHSLTDFKHNAKRFVEELRTTRSPLVLTVNGKAAMVALDVVSFEEWQNRIRELEEEVQALKLGALKEAVAQGVEQAEKGQFSKRDFDEIIASARAAVPKSPGA